MSALGQKRTFRNVQSMSALPPKADIRPRDQDVCFGPQADLAAYQRPVPFIPQYQTLAGAGRTAVRLSLAEPIVCSIDVGPSFGARVRVLSEDVDRNPAVKSKSSLLLFGAVERTLRALLQSTENAEFFLTGSVTFVHAFCTRSPSFRMKSPHRSHIEREA
jgi:hypothetical protein